MHVRYMKIAKDASKNVYRDIFKFRASLILQPSLCEVVVFVLVMVVLMKILLVSQVTQGHQWREKHSAY